ncbi:MAG: DoxX family protein [Candidatus Thermoplasmatota archaeon]|nr:DoxX family protein [Candidatus Thermoplasmatota archaeon]
MRTIVYTPSEYSKIMIDELVTVLQITIAVVIIAVWVFRPRLETSFRAGNAKNIVEEFAVYGLPKWSVYVIGITKLGLATLLILGIWYSSLVQYAALAMGLLMAGAVVCHLKTKGDPLSRATPASLMLIMCVVVFYLG